MARKRKRPRRPAKIQAVKKVTTPGKEWLIKISIGGMQVAEAGRRGNVLGHLRGM